MILRAFPATGRRQGGFSLIEVIAAFLIFAIGFGVLLQILTGSLRIAHRSAEDTQATLWAESLLDQVGVGEPLKEGTDSGQFDNTYHWSMVVTKVEPPVAQMGVEDADAAAAQMGRGNTTGRQPLIAPQTATAAGVQQDTGIDLYQVELTVSWGQPGMAGGHHVVFTTLRAIDANQSKLREFGRDGMPGQ